MSELLPDPAPATETTPTPPAESAAEGTMTVNTAAYRLDAITLVFRCGECGTLYDQQPAALVAAGTPVCTTCDGDAAFLGWRLEAESGPAEEIPRSARRYPCDECGETFRVNDDGTSNHLDPDEAINHDADADHVPYML